MKTIYLSLVFMCIYFSAFAQWGDNYIKLSHNITTEDHSVSSFDIIEVSEDFEIYIRFSDSEQKIEIEANENLHDLIRVKSDGQTLKINTASYSTSYNSKRRGLGAKEKLIAYITTNTLSEIRANEDVKVVLENKFYGDNLSITLDEDSTLEGFIEVQNLLVKLDEDSILEIEGQAQTMEVDADEDSIIEGMNFIVNQRLDIRLNEDSKAKLTVNGKIDLRAKEDSYFYYKGAGSFVRKRLTGDSEIRNW